MLKVGRIFETVNQYEGNTSVGKRQDSSLKKHHKWSSYIKKEKFKFTVIKKMNIKPIVYHFCLLPKQDVFHSKLQKTWLNVAQKTYYLIQKSLVWSQFLRVNLVPLHAVWSLLFPPFSLHFLVLHARPGTLWVQQLFLDILFHFKNGKKKKGQFSLLRLF